MKNGKILLGALAGLAAGALLGILFAPDKGSETRKKIVKKSGDVKDNLKEKINSLINEMEGKKAPSANNQDPVS